MINENDPLSGGLFGKGSFGHCGYTGTSMFFDREKQLYVVLLTNTARFAYREEASHEHVRGRCLKVRSSVHAAIKKDLDI
jgi:CubicO group peptidase (beta-lactamase class C family)